MHKSWLVIFFVFMTSPLLAEERVIVVTSVNGPPYQADVPSGLAPGDVVVLRLQGISDDKARGWDVRLGDVQMAETVSEGVVQYTGTVPATVPAQLIATEADGTSLLALPLSAPAPQPKVTPEIRLEPTYEQRRNLVNLYFDTDGLLHEKQTWPRDIDDNDVIQIYVVGTESKAKGLRVSIEGTLASADGYPVLASGSLSDVKSSLVGTIQSTAGEEFQVWNLGAFGPFKAGTITIKIQKDEAGTLKTIRDYPRSINPTYFAAYRLTRGESDIRFSEFAIGPVSGQEQPRIHDQSDPGGEPRYFLTVVPYIWKFWDSESWRGRDVNKPPASLLDRVNPAIGVGLGDAGKEFLAAVSIEVFRGVDVIWGWHVAEVQKLGGGFKEGDIFEATPETLPIQDDWVTERGFLGVSLDLRVAVELLKSVVQ